MVFELSAFLLNSGSIDKILDGFALWITKLANGVENSAAKKMGENEVRIVSSAILLFVLPTFR